MPSRLIGPALALALALGPVLASPAAEAQPYGYGPHHGPHGRHGGPGGASWERLRGNYERAEEHLASAFDQLRSLRRLSLSGAAISGRRVFAQASALSSELVEVERRLDRMNRIAERMNDRSLTRGVVSTTRELVGARQAVDQLRAESRRRYVRPEVLRALVNDIHASLRPAWRELTDLGAALGADTGYYGHRRGWR